MENKVSRSNGAGEGAGHKRTGRHPAAVESDSGLAASLRLAIVDRDAEFRRGVKLLLDLQPHLSVVSETAALTDLASTTGIDIVLLYGLNGADMAEIAATSRRCHVIVVMPGEQREESLTALRIGVRGVVFKRLAIDALINAIDAVGAGHVWVPPTLQASIVAGMREPTITNLTAREHEITRLVARGLRNAEIAARLYISEQTVKTHLNNVFHKLELRDRVELALYATRNGIVDARDDFPARSGRPSRSAA